MSITIKNKVNLKGSLSLGLGSAPAIPVPAPGIVSGYPDFDLVSPSPTPLTLNVELGGQSIVSNGDRMTYIIYLEAGVFYKISMGGPGFDSVMYMYDENGGDSVAYDDESGGLGLSAIEYSPPSSGYYYVGVMGYDDGEVGTYSILAEVLPPPAYWSINISYRPLAITKDATHIYVAGFTYPGDVREGYRLFKYDLDLNLVLTSNVLSGITNSGEDAIEHLMFDGNNLLFPASDGVDTHMYKYTTNLVSDGILYTNGGPANVMSMVYNNGIKCMTGAGQTSPKSLYSVSNTGVATLDGEIPNSDYYYRMHQNNTGYVVTDGNELTDGIEKFDWLFDNLTATGQVESQCWPEQSESRPPFMGVFDGNLMWTDDTYGGFSNGNRLWVGQIDSGYLTDYSPV